LGEAALMYTILIPASYIGPVIAYGMGITYLMGVW
jgi:hypothetical protein